MKRRSVRSRPAPRPKDRKRYQVPFYKKEPGTFWFLFVCGFLLSPLAFSENNSDPILLEVAQLRDQKLYEQAENVLKNAISASPAQPEYHLEMANLYGERFDRLQDSRDEETQKRVLIGAESELKQTLSLDPEHIPAFYNLGVVYKRLGQYEQSREMFRNVLERDPRQVNAWMQIGATYEEQGFFEEARDAYEKAREMDFANPEIKFALEDLAQSEKKWNQKERLQTGPLGTGALRRNFPFSEGGQASLYEAARLGDRNSNSGISQALPYLGSWLVQEFMKARSRSKSADL